MNKQEENTKFGCKRIASSNLDADIDMKHGKISIFDLKIICRKLLRYIYTCLSNVKENFYMLNLFFLYLKAYTV